MESKKEQQSLKEQFRIIDESLKNNTDVVSSTDLTGLISTLPANEEQAKAYKDIYPTVKTGNLQDFKKNL